MTPRRKRSFDESSQPARNWRTSEDVEEAAETDADDAAEQDAIQTVDSGVHDPRSTASAKFSVAGSE